MNARDLAAVSLTDLADILHDNNKRARLLANWPTRPIHDTVIDAIRFLEQPDDILAGRQNTTRDVIRALKAIVADTAVRALQAAHPEPDATR